MSVSLSLISVFIAPLILLVMWLLCLWQLRSVTLTALTLISALIIYLSSEGNLLLLQRNPYAMLIALVLVIFTILLIPHVKPIDRPYMIAADSVLLLMFLALHLWRIYLRQSNAYITETNLYFGNVTSLMIVLFSLSAPVLMIINYKVPERAFTFGIRFISMTCVFIVFLSVVFTQ